ncbi:hypothetical protein Tco_1008298 [Tanacetum coccineum]
MAPKKRNTRALPATTTTTTSVTNAQLKALIDKGVADALAARDVDRSMNGDDSHNSGWGVRRNERVAQLKKKMTDKYCPRSEIKKLEVEMWNLKVKGTDVIGYNQCFQELALLCVRMFPEESDKIKRYVGGLPDMIHGKNKRKQADNNNQTQQQPLKKQGVAIAYAAWSGEKKEYAGTLPLCKFHHNGK